MTPHPLRDHLVGSYRGRMQRLDPMGPPGTPVHTHVFESGLRPELVSPRNGRLSLKKRDDPSFIFNDHVCYTRQYHS